MFPLWPVGLLFLLFSIFKNISLPQCHKSVLFCLHCLSKSFTFYFLKTCFYFAFHLCFVFCFFINLYRSIVDLQCCVSFCYMAKRISYKYTIPIPQGAVQVGITAGGSLVVPIRRPHPDVPRLHHPGKHPHCGGAIPVLGEKLRA